MLDGLKNFYKRDFSFVRHKMWQGDTKWLVLYFIKHFKEIRVSDKQIAKGIVFFFIIITLHADIKPFIAQLVLHFSITPLYRF